MCAGNGLSVVVTMYSSPASLTVWVTILLSTTFVEVPVVITSASSWLHAGFTGIISGSSCDHGT